MLFYLIDVDYMCYVPPFYSASEAFDLHPTTKQTTTNTLRWARTKYNSEYRGYDPSYPFMRPFVGVTTPFISSRSPCCIQHEIERTSRDRIYQSRWVWAPGFEE